jgi:hypothetical protein
MASVRVLLTTNGDDSLTLEEANQLAEDLIEAEVLEYTDAEGTATVVKVSEVIVIPLGGPQCLERSRGRCSQLQLCSHYWQLSEMALPRWRRGRVGSLTRPYAP